MKTPHIPRSEDFSHPESNADMTLERSNAYTQAYWEGNRYWRNKLDWKLTILTVVSIGSVALGKGLLKGELANYRAWTGVLVHGGLIGVAASLTDAIRQHRQAQIGWENSTRTQIETAEDLVQRQAERNFNLMGRLDGGSNGLEVSIEEFPSPLQTEDLAATLAQETGGGTLIISPPGCGKTSLVRAAMRAADSLYNSALSISVVDCKGDEDGWLGLEADPQRFFLLDDDSALEGIARLEQIKAKLKNSTPTQPSIAIIDEWNNGVSSIQNSLSASSNDKKQAISVVRQILTKGRSKKLYGWLTTHSPGTDAIGMDGATRQSMNLVALARKNKLSMIPSLLRRGGESAFVEDEDIRRRLLEQYTAYVNDVHGDFDSNVPVALTNLGGDWRLVKLPDYSGQALKDFKLPLFFEDYEDENAERSGASAGSKNGSLEAFTDRTSATSATLEVPAAQGIQPELVDELPYAYKAYTASSAVLRVPDSEMSALSAPEVVEVEAPEVERSYDSDQQLIKTQNTWNGWDDRQRLRMALLIETGINAGLSRTKIIEQRLNMSGRKFKAGCWLYETALNYLESAK